MSHDILYSTGECVLGVVLVATNERGVCAILLGGHAGALEWDLCVVRKDGSLAGYRWGVARKRALLAREAAG